MPERLLILAPIKKTKVSAVKLAIIKRCRALAGRMQGVPARMQDTSTDTATATDIEIYTERERARGRGSGSLARATLLVVMAQSGHNFNFYERAQEKHKSREGHSSLCPHRSVHILQLFIFRFN